MYNIEDGKDEAGRRYFRVTRPGSDQRPILFSADDIAKEPTKIFATFVAAGHNLFTHPAKAELLTELQEHQSGEPTFRVATKLGHSRKRFVLPSEVIGKKFKRPLFADLNHLDPAILKKYRPRGPLSNWQSQIAKLSLDNSRLMFAISLAFTGPILRYVQGPKTGGFQISGLAETGKTTAAMVAGSVWGCHARGERQEKGFVESWHTTAGKVEKTALAHNDTLLILDETRVAGADDSQRARIVSEVTFALAEAVEKERLTNSGSAHAWRGYFLSTSNQTLTELARAGGVDIDDAYLGRMFDVPCPDVGSGIYEQLHSFSSGEAMTDALKRRCRRSFGIAGPEFVKRLLAHRDTDSNNLKKFLRMRRKAYRGAIASACQKEDLTSLTRTSSRFATVYAAGCVAIRYEVLPWSRTQLLKAIMSCQLSGLRKLAQEPRAVRPPSLSPRGKLLSFLRQYQSSFVDLATNRPIFRQKNIENVPGFKGAGEEAGWFYLTSMQLHAVLGSGPGATSFKRQLLADGILAKPSQGGYVVQRRIFSGATGTKGHVWVYAINPKFLDL